MQLPDLSLDGTFPATCPRCQGAIQVSLFATHAGTDYSGEKPVQHASIDATYQHTCTPPTVSQ